MFALGGLEKDPDAWKQRVKEFEARMTALEAGSEDRNAQPVKVTLNGEEEVVMVDPVNGPRLVGTASGTAGGYYKDVVHTPAPYGTRGQVAAQRPWSEMSNFDKQVAIQMTAKMNRARRQHVDPTPYSVEIWRGLGPGEKMETAMTQHAIEDAAES
mmetsp:Transcript_32046/g.68347  ORF Transcript_32046/g.68347 Transcript_32046/m.68347 type:complete len:156 (+) Transcript_32046:175-642(+)